MAGEHADIRVQLGAFALDAVAGPERDAIARHVATCPACRRELEQLRRIAGRLSLLRGTAPGPRGAADATIPGMALPTADDDETVVALRRPADRRPGEPVLPPHPVSGDAPPRAPVPGRRTGDPALPGLPPVAPRGRRAGRRRDRRPELFPALAAAAAAAFVLLVGGLVTGFGDDDTTPPDAALAQETGPPPVAFSQAPPGVTGTAQVRDWGWGAQVDLRVAGLEGDRPHSVWLEQPDGSRVTAGSFTPNGRDLAMTFGAGATAGGSTALGVSDPDGTTVLLVALPAGR